MPVFQFWCFQVIIEWEISFSKALYIPIPHPVPKYLDLLFKALKTVKPTSVGAERAFSAMGLLLKLETEWVIKPLMHWFQWGNIISWSQKDSQNDD